jgi:RHS repeat-associated protein
MVKEEKKQLGETGRPYFVLNQVSYDANGNFSKKNHMSYDYTNVEKQFPRGCLIRYGQCNFHNNEKGQPRMIIHDDDWFSYQLDWDDMGGLKSLMFIQNSDCLYIIQYSYNKDGVRFQKDVNGCIHHYKFSGSRMIKETWNKNVLIPLYGNNGDLWGINYNGKLYYFFKNPQGDIIAIADDQWNVVVRYSYDSFGKLLSIRDARGVQISEVQEATHIGYLNPFRYRGYYYDTETHWYSIGNQYYLPETGRWLNNQGEHNEMCSNLQKKKGKRV